MKCLTLRTIYLAGLGIVFLTLPAATEEPTDDAANHSALPSLRAPQTIPEGDPWLPTTDHLPSDTQPDPIHDLDTVRTTWWDDLPPELVDRHFGDSPAQRVIFRDTLTGAEVWLICRSPGDEYEGFYSSLRNFNADGSRLEIDRHLMDVTGARVRPLSRLISRDEGDRSSIRRFQWDPEDPNSGLCQRFSGAIHRLDIRSGEERPVFRPGKQFPRDCSMLLTFDGRHMLVARQKNNPDPFLYLADGRGKVIRRIELKTHSENLSDDHMGGLRLYQDEDGNYFFSYSLNKAAARTSNPHQRWFAALDGSLYLDADELEGSLSEGYLINDKRLLLTPAGYDPMSSSLGHAGMSPTEHWLVQSDGAFLTLTDLGTHDRKHLAYVPSADHFDWSAPVDWFLHRTRRQPGLPIYRVEVPSGVAHRIVATNTDDHLAAFSYSHPSPDGTKCLYRSSMLGTLDMYLAVIRYPKPPRELTLEERSGEVHLSWKRPEPGREVRGYRVYRSHQSGGPYEPVHESLVTDESFVVPAATDATCYVVTSVEHSGLESRQFSNEVAVAPVGPAHLYLEAEAAIEIFPMREIFVPQTASDAYAITRAVHDPLWNTPQGSGEARWQVELPRAADYWLWARVRSLTNTRATVDFVIDGEPFGSGRPDRRQWHWVKVPTPRRLDKGKHLLAASMERSGCELDKLLLTSDAAFQPKAKGNLPALPPAAPAALRAEDDETGRHVVLLWEHSAGPLHHHYDIYRGTSVDLEPSQRTLLGSPVRNAFIDPQPPGSEPLFYCVVAVDSWGNRSAPSPVVKWARREPTSTHRLRIDLDETHLRGDLTLTEATAASTGPYVVLEPEGENDFIEIPLSVPPGRYLLWVRARSKGRYQTARLEVEGSRRAEKCLVIGAEASLFGDPIWAWRRVQSLSSSTVPRRTPVWLTVSGDKPTLTIRSIDGYSEIDQVFLTNSVHDLPDPSARWFSPVNAYRFKQIATEK